jgi:hypothetical protein
LRAFLSLPFIAWYWKSPLSSFSWTTLNTDQRSLPSSAFLVGSRISLMSKTYPSNCSLVKRILRASVTNSLVLKRVLTKSYFARVRSRNSDSVV